MNPGNSKYQLLPEGNIEVVLNLGDPERVFFVRDGSYQGEFRQSQLVGQRKQPILLEQTGMKYKVGIRFLPGGLDHFLQTPLSEIIDSSIDLEYLFKSDCRALEDQLNNVRNTKEIFNSLQKVLLSRFNPDIHRDEIVDLVIRQIRLTSGNVSLKKIADKLGISQKQLERRFKAKIGLPPKQFSQIIRFQTVLKKIKKNGMSDLLSVIYDCGFYDQSHFIKEFKSFTGTTPYSFFSQNDSIIELNLPSK